MSRAARRSLQARLLTPLIRLTVRPGLSRAVDPERERRRFLRTVRWFLPDPRGARFASGRMAGLPVVWATPPGGGGGGVILYLHGGAFVLGSPRTHRALAARLAGAAGLRALIPHYRRPPEHPFPAALEDALAVYAALLDQGQDPGRLALAGDSSGGALALALAGELDRRGWPMPAALVGFSPLVDLTFSGASWQENRRRDPMLPAERGPDMVAMWLQGADPTDPRASPLFADWARPPPTLLFAAESELLRDDATRMAARLAAAGGRAEARIGPDLPHVWPFLCPWLPEGCATIAEAGAFLSACLGPAQAPDKAPEKATDQTATQPATQPAEVRGVPTSR